MKDVLRNKSSLGNNGRDFSKASFDPILRLPQVKALTGLGKSSIYSAMRKGSFPKSRALGARAIGWIQSDIVAWIESRKAASYKEAA